MNNNINHINIINCNSININNGNLSLNIFNNQTIYFLLQYMNMLSFNLNNNNPFNINTYYSSINNNSMNLFQFMPNLMNFGFNQPYSFDNVKKKEPKKETSDFNKKKFHNNNNNNNFNFSSHKLSKNNNFNNYEDSDSDENNEKKFMRKISKSERIEIDKWVEARKKLYSTKNNIEIKNKIGEIKIEKGLMSILEIKLRKKVNILKKLSSSKKSLKRRKQIRNFNQNKFKSKIKKRK